MHNAVAILLLLLLFYLFYVYYLQYTQYNTTAVSLPGDKKYYIHNSHNDKIKAAHLMQEITKRNNILINHLKEKYFKNKYTPALDPTKNNHIDIIPETELYSADSMFTGGSIFETEYVQERINQLINHYNPDHIYEISPLNASGVTSYTQDKKTLIMCLRKKEKNAKGENELHDINTIMFVDLHELSHMMNNLWGHKVNFWLLFKFMLMNAVECDIYKPVNYAVHPILYCGLLLTYNPLFDKIM